MSRVKAPASEYCDAEHGVLALRGSMTPGTRRQYAELSAGVREDLYARRIEFLVERLAVRWTVGDVDYTRQKELLARFRAASREERDFLLRAVREHCAEFFPEVETP